MPGRPLVTVLLSVHNDLRFLPQAVESILAQAFDDFELLIIDDGSTDGSGVYLDELRDSRIRVRRNVANLGLTCSLNLGLDAAAGRWVARMDADDVSEPDRLERQVAFFQANADVGIVGTSRTLIDERGVVVAHAPAVESDVDIRWKCLLGNPFAHPTVMFRLDLLNAHRLRYDESFRTAQDYELWTRLLMVTRGANLPEPLLRYRLREGVSRVHKSDQLHNHDRIASAAIRRLVPGLEINGHDVSELRGRYGGHSVRDPAMHRSDPRWQALYGSLRLHFLAAYDPERRPDERFAAVASASAFC
jgi:glycosyltransferase involved in cell wall biosynthesis